MLYRCKVAYKQQSFFLLVRFSQEGYHIVLAGNTVNPLKTFRIKVFLIHSRMALVKVVQSLYIILHILVNRIIQNLPRKLFIFIPLRNLSKFLAHKQQLLTRMSIHKAVGCPQIVGLGLIIISRHLAQHGCLSVNHLIMGEYQNEILAVRIQHTKGQLSVMMVAEIRITLHITGKIIHPAHVPFIIKAQAVFLYITGNLRPCCGFLCNQNRSSGLLFKDTVQML